MSWKRKVVAIALATLAMRGDLATAQAAGGRIVGTVTESVHGQPLANVFVAIVGGALGSRTGATGRFAIAGVPPGRYVVRAQLLGYAARTDTVQVASGETTTADFVLQQRSVSLEEVVVIGYGTQRRSDLTGSVASVTPQVERTPTISLEQTLQGTAPGVQVTTASSAPGGGMSIRIRGGSSVSGNNEPLYVIDGFPIENDPANSSPTSGGREASSTVPANPLAALNPNDIASIEILKDASATSIYGARGANGVIIITTKRGSPGAPKVTLDSYTGVQSIAKRYDMLNAQGYGEFANSWVQLRTANPPPFADPASLPETDWQSEIFRTAPISSVQLGLTGGTAGDNQTRYALSGGVLQQQGIVRGSDFKRISLRANLDQTIGSHLRLGTNLLLNRIRSSQVPTDGSFNQGAGAVLAALQYIPVMPVHRPDGSYTLAASDFPTELTSIGIGGVTQPNPVATALEVSDPLGDTRLLASTFGEVRFLDAFTFRTNIGSDLSDRTRDTYFPRTTLQGQRFNGRAIRGDLNNTSWLTEYTLSYAHSFGDAQRVQAVTGYTRQVQSSVRTSVSSTNFVNDITGFENIGAGSPAGGPTISSGRTRWTLASYLGRVNYTLRDRYLLTVTGRRDGSSRFGADNRWGFFPSAAVGWRVSEEPFMRRFTAIDQLKLRVSYGVAGNPSISPYQSISRLGAQQYEFGGGVVSGYAPAALGNDRLTWESTRQADYGVDLTAYQGRVDLAVDYYDKRTNNLLLQIDLPPQSGFATSFVNAGAIGNRGIEIGLTLRPFVADRTEGGFGWTSVLSYARNRNKVLDLGPVDRVFAATTNSDVHSSGSLVQVGQPIGVFYGYKTAGLFRDQPTLDDWNAKTKFSSGSPPTLGSTIFVDTNGDSLIDANDRTIIGDPTPKFTGGMQNNFEYRGFQLNTLLDGSYGGKIFNLNLFRLEGASPGGNILRERFLDAWSPTNPDGKYARIGTGIGTLGADFTDQLIEDGSFLRLRTVSLSRDLPAAVLGRVGMNAARVYVTGQNLYTWTRYSGFNPDVSSLGVGNTNRGIDIGAYPLARTFIFGINLGY